MVSRARLRVLEVKGVAVGFVLRILRREEGWELRHVHVVGVRLLLLSPLLLLLLAVIRPDKAIRALPQRQRRGRKSTMQFIPPIRIMIKLP
jgi:hypothetical protein